jgi:hypothetical protein
MMDIGKAFLFVIEDKEWVQKIVIGGALTLFFWLLIPMLIVSGYQVAVMRRIVNDEPNLLPEWTDISGLLKDGLVIWIAGFVYALPAVLLALCSLVIWLPAIAGDATLAGLSVLGMILFSCLIVLYGIALALFVPALFIQYVRSGDFSSLFKIGDVVGIIRENIVSIIIIFLVIIVANFLLNMVAWIPVIGQLIILPAGTFWIGVATAYLYGSLARGVDDGKVKATFKTA